jgi:long-chain acyl-CoA synthetase
MTAWIKDRNKVALIYREQTYTYKMLMTIGTGFRPLKINHNGIVICDSEDPLDQLFHVIYGLLNQRPVFLGRDSNDDLIGRGEDLENVFLVATTSGTTGRKKYLYKKNSQWLDSFGGHSRCFGIDSRDILFTNGSLAYTANLYSALHILSIGGTLILSDERNPKQWIDIIEKTKATVGFLVPSKLRLLSRSIKETWYYKIEITTAGEALNQKFLSQLMGKCPSLKVHHYYGAAEIGHVSYIRHEDLLEDSKSVGRPFPGVKIKIDSEIIYVKSPYGALQGQGYESAYDCGEIKPNGHLYVMGRKDSQINNNGRKFDATQVAEIVNQEEKVLDCIIVPLERGKKYGLYILCVASNGQAIQEEIERAIIKTFPRWQWPVAYRFVSKGLYSDSGKYDMVRIRDLFTEFE